MAQNKSILLSLNYKKNYFTPKSRKYAAGKLEDGAGDNIRT
jgi:hypothetical protein